MKNLFAVTTVSVVILLATLPGCDRKKDKSGQWRAEQNNSDVAVPSSDEADASVAKDRVLLHLKAGDFSSVFREASPGFREIGKEENFMALWQQQLQDTGVFKEFKEISHAVRPEDKHFVFIYHIQYENAKKELRLVFGRSKNGKMELTGIHQTDMQNMDK